MIDTIGKRDISFDVARALSALWVVGVWHLLCYDTSIDYANWTTQQVTDVFLSVFMFLSGFMLGKYSFASWRDVLVFYKKRFWRFYVLYVLSSVTLYIGGMIIGNQIYAGVEQLFLSFLGLNVLFPPHLGTLWFISMIMFFYLFTPLLSFRWKSRVTNYVVALVVLLFFLLWREVTGYVENYVCYMFPVYTLGLLLPHEITIKAKKTPVVAVVCLLVFITVIPVVKYISHLKVLSLLIKLLCLLLGVFFVLGISEFLSHNRFARWFFEWVAYSSLCVYLFHRHVYSLLHSLAEHMNVTINIFILWLVFLPTALVCAFLIQKLYDRLLSKYVLK